MEKNSIKEYMEYSEERFTKRIIYNTGETTAFVLNFLPGQQLPSHKHPGSEVYLLIVAGGGIFTIDGKETDAVKGDFIHMDGDENMAFKNSSSEPASLYVVLSKGSD